MGPNKGFNKCLVTTSWDDGFPLDSRIADLLLKYNLKGTFYIPLANAEHELMDKETIKRVAREFEIGGHTLNHKDLSKITLAEAKNEIISAKAEMEDLIGKKLEMFCYPKGHFNQGIKDIVKDAGFIGARTCERFYTQIPRDRFRIPTTIQVYPHPVFSNYRHLICHGNFTGLKAYMFINPAKMGWGQLAAQWYDLAAQNGGIWHIWGHSWEIQEMNLWDELERVLSLVSNDPTAEYCANSKIVKYAMHKNNCI